MDNQTLIDHVIEMGATQCRSVPAGLLVPKEKIREYCRENKCGSYGKNLMCPPHTGTIAEIREKLNMFGTGLLIQYSEALDVRNDQAGLRITKLKLHRVVLETELHLHETIGSTDIFGLIGGDCSLCDECEGYREKPCIRPDKARPSLEALGIDVVGLLEELNMESAFQPGRITWTGMVLYNESRQLSPNSLRSR